MASTELQFLVYLQQFFSLAFSSIIQAFLATFMLFFIIFHFWY